jgi:hypothetical protein
MTNGSIFTNNARKIFINRTYKSVPDYAPLSVLQCGINNTTPNITDTALVRKIPFSNTESVDSCDVDNWSDGTDSAATLNTVTFKEGTGSISLTKSGTAGTVMSMSKTTTSRDFTSKDFSVWVYITALSDLVSTGTAITVRFGSDSSNYYYYNVDISALSAGWNLILFSSATATGTTSSPTITACDYTYIAFNTDLAADTIAANRILIDDIKLASSGDYNHSLDSGYPIIDETNMETTLQYTILSTEANGYNINGTGVFNTDATPKLGGEDTFFAESKSNTDQIIFVFKDRVI